MKTLCRLRSLLLFTGIAASLSPACSPLAAQPCGTPGRDGSGTITGVVNTYYPGTASVAAGGPLSIPVGSPSGAAAAIAAGDLLLVIQMQDAAINSTDTSSYGDGVNGGVARGVTALNSSGLYEFVVATGPVSGGSVPILSGGNGGVLLNSYTNAAATGTQGQRRFQVIRVPQYSGVTLSSGLTALAWNGSVGGVLAIDVSGAVALGNATVSLDGRGFRGGGGRSIAGSGTGFSSTVYRTLATQTWHGSKAEGIAGTPRYLYDGTSLVDTTVEGYPNGSYARGAPGNAGGGGNDGATNNGDNSGGGGGANAGNGGNGGNTWDSNLAVGGYGGAAVPPTASRLTSGGGGGAGVSNNTGPAHGARGGGIILFRFNSVSGTGTLSTNGSAAGLSTQDGGGGGGAGGSVFAAACNDTSFTGLTVNARGGVGGSIDWDDNDHHGPGGGGGGGAVFLSRTATISVTGGANGTSPPSSAYGATAGSNGTSSTTITVSSAPGARPGCTCAVTQALVHSFRAVPDGRSVTVEWQTASEVATAGFRLFRREPETGAWQEVAGRLLAAAREAPQGALYRVADPGASFREPQTYMLQEIETRGRSRWYGPFFVTPDAAISRPGAAAGFARRPRAPNAVVRNPEPVLQAIPFLGGPPAGSATALKLRVREAGVYSVPAAAIASAFLVSEDTARSWIGKGRLRLTGRAGKTVWFPAPGDGEVLFYGEDSKSLFTSENVYWLSPDPLQPKPQRGTGGSPAADPGRTFQAALHAEQDRFPAIAIAPDPTSDYWFWETLVAGDATFGTRSVAFDLRAVAPGGGALTMQLQGATSSGAASEHQVDVRLNGSPLGTAVWQGVRAYTATFAVAAGLFREGSNTVELTARLEPDVPFSVSYVDAVDVSFPRFYRAEGGFLELRGGGNPVVTVEGFTSPGIQVWDLGTARLPLPLDRITVEPAAGGGWQASFVPATRERPYVVFDPAGLRTPGIEAWIAPPVALLDPRNAADHLIVAPAVLAEAAEELAAHRRTQGLDSRVVLLEQIWDEISGGLPDPEALRLFFQQAARSWKRPPRFVVLAGNGTYDYRNLLGYGDNFVPPVLVQTSQGVFASDTRLVEGTGIRIGRLPVTSAAELSAVVAKIAAYESAAAGPWQRSVLLVADNADEGGQFDWESDLAAARVPRSYSTSRISLSETPLAEARQQLFDHLAEGAFLVNFIGHAGLDRLTAEPLLASADLPALANGDRLPVLAAMSCVVGRFEIPGFSSLAEQLVLWDGGGAIAVWAPSGTNYNAQSGALDRAFLEALFKTGGDSTLGGAVERAAARFREAGGSADVLRGYNLFGDPALLLRQGG